MDRILLNIVHIATFIAVFHDHILSHNSSMSRFVGIMLQIISLFYSIFLLKSLHYALCSNLFL